MWPPEDGYGLAKRAEFVCAEIDRRSPRSVLDYGCGTGANLTIPLAERYAQIRFLGVDNDPESIAHASSRTPMSNLVFRVSLQECIPDERFDLIIASEVLEHVEDPPGFLNMLRGRLADGGAIVLTVPNGYGPFEVASLAETLLQITRVYGVLRRVKRAVTGAAPHPPTQVDTLAQSPHVNFFAFGELLGLFPAHRLRLVRYRARTFLCGFGFDQLMRGRRLLAWNARVADRLPPQLVSGWMFVLEAAEHGGVSDYRRGAYARLRRRLNLRKLKRSTPEQPA